MKTTGNHDRIKEFAGAIVVCDTKGIILEMNDQAIKANQDAGGKKLIGLAGLTTGEVMLRGVLQSRNSYVALLAGPDGKTYSARVNDRLLDGVIRSVTPQGIVIMQEVNDPLSLVKQREVRKGLRTAEDGK